MQTVALARLLGPCWGVFRDDPLPPEHAGIPLVANGWLGTCHGEPAPEAYFAGVHISREHARFAQWFRRSPQPAGARDPFTAGLLRGHAPAELTGCATLTFDRYRGPRSGRYSIDADPRPDTEILTQWVASLDWRTEWSLALQRLELLRKAEIVYTSRLHVVLPCLAFGTPVMFPFSSLEKIKDKERLTLLDELPFAYDEPVTADVSPMSERYLKHLRTCVGDLRMDRVATMPQPIVFG